MTSISPKSGMVRTVSDSPKTFKSLTLWVIIFFNLWGSLYYVPTLCQLPLQFGFTESILEWFYENGCEWIKPEMEPGDLVLWDSRTAHYNVPPLGEVDRCAVCEWLFFKLTHYGFR